MPRQNSERETLSKIRPAVLLNAALDKKLLTYAAVAGAAGVSVLTLSQAAGAEIIYTLAHTHINHSTVLDLNHDGITDFSFTGYRTVGDTAPGAHRNTTYVSTNAALSILGVGSANQVWGKSVYASALRGGVPIGSSGQFPGGKRLARARDIDHLYGALGGYGPWAGSGTHHGVKNRYLGLKFMIDGETHFGWARLTVAVRVGAVIDARITGYAYETVANTPIIAGRTHEADTVGSLENATPTPIPMLGLLAQGAPAIAIWRRDQDDSLN